jgi:predicted trehalose synthase
MIRSFHYAASSALLGDIGARGRLPGLLRPEDVPVLKPWIQAWQVYVSAAFLKAYLARTQQAPFMPDNRDDYAALLDAFLLEKSLRELQHELDRRAHWVVIPIQGLQQLLGLDG